jgi:hypothetical protein
VSSRARSSFSKKSKSENFFGAHGRYFFRPIAVKRRSTKIGHSEKVIFEKKAGFFTQNSPRGRIRLRLSILAFATTFLR